MRIGLKLGADQPELMVPAPWLKHDAGTGTDDVYDVPITFMSLQARPEIVSNDTWQQSAAIRFGLLT
jgi:hypothetical protein